MVMTIHDRVHRALCVCSVLRYNLLRRSIKAIYVTLFEVSSVAGFLKYQLPMFPIADACISSAKEIRWPSIFLTLDLFCLFIKYLIIRGKNKNTSCQRISCCMLYSNK